MPLTAALSKAEGVGVYSPSGSFADTAEKTRLFDIGVQRLRDHGFTVRESAHCRATWHHMSAPAIDRVADLHELADDPDVDVILPSIGGHVAAQMLPLVDFDRIAASGSALFGFSDNSILPLVTTDRTGALSFHSLCDVTFGWGRFGDMDYQLTQRSMLDALRHGRFDLAGTTGWKPVQHGSGHGVILGGNLRAIARLAGTPWWPDWREKIMFWETGDELHSVAQDLVQLGLAGAFDDLAGMVIGHVAGLPENFYRPDQVAPLSTVLLDILDLRGRFPIIAEADIGHDIDNVTIPLGAHATLTTDDSAIAWTIDTI